MLNTTFDYSLTTEDGLKRIVRNGYLPEREIQTGIGPLAVQVPRVRDRDPSGSKIDFSSAIIPRYLRRSKSIETLLPLLYLKGISTGDFKGALAPILGEEAKNLSPSVICRLKTAWEGEYEQWQKHDCRHCYLPEKANLMFYKTRSIGTSAKGVRVLEGERRTKRAFAEIPIGISKRFP